MLHPVRKFLRGRRLLAAALLSASLLALGVPLASNASAVAVTPIAGLSATVTAPSCGRVATLSLTNNTAKTVQFWLRQPVTAHSFAWLDVPAHSSTTVKRMMQATSENWGVVVGSKVILSQQITSTPNCFNGQWIITPAATPVGVAISPGCSNQANVTIRNITAATIKFDIMRSGTAGPVYSLYQAPTLASTLTVPINGNTGSTVSVMQGTKVISSQLVLPSPVCAPPSTVGWGAPVASDEFNGTTLDTSKWYVYNNPTANYPRVPQAVSESGNELKITGQIYPDINGAPHDESGGIGMTFGQKYGRYEVRFRTETGQGYAPVITLWPDSEKWPGDGEIDLIEIPNGGRQADSSWFHDGGGDNAVHNKTNHTIRYDFTNWAVMDLDWEPNSLSLSLNGVVQFSTTDPKYIPTTSSMHLTLQQDVTAIPWGIPRLPTTPAQVTMHVDYARAYASPNTVDAHN